MTTTPRTGDPAGSLHGLWDERAPGTDEVGAIAGGLVDHGVQPGDRVAFQRPNATETAHLFRACWWLGAVAVPLHHRLDTGAAAALSTTVGAAAVFGPTDDLPRARPPTPTPSSGEDDAVVLFTAGSTGEPKGVRHTHRALRHKATQMVTIHGLGPTDAVLMPAPASHVSGLLNGLLVPAAAGMSTVWMARWDPERALDAIAAHSVTFMVGPPTFFVAMDDAAPSADLTDSSLRLVSTGGTGVTEAFCRHAAARFGAVVKRTYGSTEAPTVAATPVRFHQDTTRCWASDGHATPGTSLRLAPDGELWVRGPELFAGYLPHPDRSPNPEGLTRDGWFATGDTAVLDDGWVTITGRTKELIIRGGENIVPSLVETHLEAHPDVRAAVVVGVADPLMGQRVATAVVLEPGSTLGHDDLVRWFGVRSAARHTVPEVIVAVDRLPVLPAGKTDRAAVAALCQARADRT